MSSSVRLKAPASTVTRDLSIDGGGPIPGTPLGARIPSSPGWMFWVALIGTVGALMIVAHREKARQEPLGAAS